MIATTIEQSKKLVELGIDPSTADMYYEEEINLPKLVVGDYKLHIQCMEDKDYRKLSNPVLSPAWSLSALLELMPRSIKSEKNGQIYLSFHRGYEDKWMIEYSFDDIDRDYLEVKFEQKDPIDTAFNMVAWLKKNKYI